MTLVNFSEVRHKVEEFLELADDLGFVIASRFSAFDRICQKCQTRFKPEKSWQKFCSPRCKRASRWEAKKANRELAQTHHRL